MNFYKRFYLLLAALSSLFLLSCGNVREISIKDKHGRETKITILRGEAAKRSSAINKLMVQIDQLSKCIIEHTNTADNIKAASALQRERSRDTRKAFKEALAVQDKCTSKDFDLMSTLFEWDLLSCQQTKNYASSDKPIEDFRDELFSIIKSNYDEGVKTKLNELAPGCYLPKQPSGAF